MISLICDIVGFGPASIHYRQLVAINGNETYSIKGPQYPLQFCHHHHYSIDLQQFFFIRLA